LAHSSFFAPNEVMRYLAILKRQMALDDVSRRQIRLVLQRRYGNSVLAEP
jgi:hypothetical protein